MIYKIDNLPVSLNYKKDELNKIAAFALNIPEKRVLNACLIKKSVDARDKSKIKWVVSLKVDVEGGINKLPKNVSLYTEPEAPKFEKAQLKYRPVVVGMGPCGLFAAYALCKMGLSPIIIERGKPVEQRAHDVNAFFAGSDLDPESNVLFGEGGAGTFSDGKLNTGIKDKCLKYILRVMHEMGAPEEILYEAKPHVGTDMLRAMVKNLRNEIIKMGGTVLFETRLVGLIIQNNQIKGITVLNNRGTTQIETEHVVLATGHSARDVFELLNNNKALMERKPFAIGARVEHSQKMINRSQYGSAADTGLLGAADYKLFSHLKNGRTVYTFCMCPGGTVVASASERGGVVTNGMSLFARDKENANSALLVSVEPNDFPGNSVLAGVEFQRMYEQAAFKLTGESYKAPAQLVGDFLKNKPSKSEGSVKPTYMPGVTYTSLDKCLPNYVCESLRQGIIDFSHKIKGFDDYGAVLTGVETRSSSPVRVLRNESYQSSIMGLYPAGEGAGYAGGIMSAAVDGMRVAMAIGQLNEDK